MDWLNQILWLKCRLSWRAHQVSPTSTFGTFLLFVFSFLPMVAAAGVLAAFIVILHPCPADELTHVSLSLMYVLWITSPIVGYRISEFFDVTRLLVYPVTPCTLFTGMVLSSFLDPPSFLVYPVLAGLLAAITPSLAALPFTFAVVALFVVQTFAVGQLALFLLVHLLNVRRVSELVLIVVPIVLLLSLSGLELFAIFGSPMDRWTWDLPPSTYTSFFPPGVAANALIAIRDGDLSSALYNGLMLVLVCALTLIVSGRLVDRVLRGFVSFEPVPIRARRLSAGGESRPPAETGQRSPDRGQGCVAGEQERVPSGRQLLGLWVKELKITLREPQVRMVIGFFLGTVMFFVIKGAVFHQADDLDGTLPSLLALSIFMMVAVFLNSLALQREGLKLLFTAPLAPVVLLIGDNLAHWVIATSLSLLTVFPVGWAFQVPATECLGCFIASQLALVLLLGVGNVASATLPCRLPAKGIQPRHETTAGQQFLIVFTGGLLCSLSLMVVLVLSFVVFSFPVGDSREAFAALSLPVALCVILGLYAVSTALAAWIMSVRRERLLVEICD